VDDVINVRDRAAVLRRRWRIVAFCTIAALAAAIGLSALQSPVYEAAARLEVGPVSAVPLPSSGVVLPPEEVATQVQILLSVPVAERVREQLGLSESADELLDSVTVAQETDARVLTVTASRSSAEQAQLVANGFAESYLSFRREQALAQSNAAEAALQDEAAGIREDLDGVLRRLPGATGSTLARLQSEQQSLLVQLTQVLGDLRTVSSGAPEVTGGGQILVPASAPGAAASPQPLRNAALGGFLGLILGIGVAFLRDHFDDAVQDDDRLREVASQRPILGRIPLWRNPRRDRLVTVLEPASPVSEAYRTLSTNVRFLAAASPTMETRRSTSRRRMPAAQKGGVVLLVTSPAQAEGKTTVASNLAVVAARFGLRVTLVDADLRHSRLANVFGLGEPPGLSDLLVSDEPTDDFLIEVEGLKVLAGGSISPNPAELLASARAREVLTSLSRTADLLIVDTPPVTAVADALELVGLADLVLLVARHGQTRLRAVADSAERIRQIGGTLAGVVYNCVPASSSADQVYGYGYAHDPGRRESRTDDEEVSLRQLLA